MTTIAQVAKAVNPITHSHYKNALFMTGNVCSNHQFSWIIRSDKARAAIENPNRPFEELVKFDLSSFKNRIPQWVYQEIFENAMNGISQTVYLIRHNDVKQAVMVLNGKGECVLTYYFIERAKTYELIDQIKKILAEKQNQYYQMLVERNQIALLS